MRRPTLFVALAPVLFAVGACNDDGRALAPAPTVPVSRETTTTTGPPPTVAPEGALSLSSPAFAGGELLDPSFTCDGVDVPPPLDIGGVPAGTSQLAIVVTDADAGGFVHWVLGGLAPEVTRVESGLIPESAGAARSDGGVEGWQGPCPPEGDPPHTYEFVLYALAEPVDVAGADGRDAIGRIESSAIASDVLVGTYARAETG